MATRSGISERKLKPVWDAIDHRQYKTALKLATALLTKYPDSAYLFLLKATVLEKLGKTDESILSSDFESLKALVLEKLGKTDEASALALRAKATNPSDDITLTTLQTVFQRLNNLEAATSLFEQACSQNPKSVELQTAMFNCYVRQYFYVRQQQVAMKLYKSGGEERYLLWAVCSVILQVNDANRKLLQLAEALLKKHFDAHGFQEREGLEVYVEVLKRQEKYGEALKLLNDLSGDLFTIATDRLRLQGELLVHLHRYEDAAIVFQKILKSSSDDWVAFRMYLDVILRSKECSPCGADSLSSSMKDKIEESLQQVHAFVLELQELKVTELRRGPHLAILEIEKQRLLLAPHKISTETPSVCLAESILKYFQRFGSMASVSVDLMEYIPILERGQREWLVNELHQYCQDLPVATPIKALRFRLAAYQVERQLGWQARVTETGLNTVAKEIGQLFLQSVELSVDVDSEEALVGGEFLTLITDILVELYLRTQNLGYILEAILVLELGLALRRFHPHHKFLLVNLYTFLSAINPAWERFKTLDVKYILLESMSHHILPSLVSSLEWDALDTMLREIVKFHDDYRREAAELVIQAYNHGTYTKVLEFVAFKHKLERSHQLMVARIESGMLALKRKANTLEEVEAALLSMDGGQVSLGWVSETQLNVLSFNEDLQTRPWWSPTPDMCLLTGSSQSLEKTWSRHIGDSEIEERHQKQRAVWKKSLTHRCLLPKMLHLALTITSGNKEAELAVGLELKELVMKYAKAMGVCDEDLGPWLKHRVSSIDPKELDQPQMGGEELVTLALFWAASQLPVQRHDPSCPGDQFANSLMLVNKLIAASLHDAMHITTSGPKVLASGAALTKIATAVTESFAWLGLCLQSWVSGLQPGGKKKKHGQPALETPEMNVLGVLHEAMTSFCSQLEVCSSWAVGQIDTLQGKGVESLLAVVDVDNSSPAPGCILGTLTTGLKSSVPETWQQKTILGDIVGSQQATLVGIRDRCNARLQLMKSIKF